MSRSGVAPQRTQGTGLQAERTSLSWERTGLALLANGALLLLRHLRGSGWAALVPAALGLLLALVFGVLGSRRARQIRDHDSVVPDARRALLLSGAAVVLFGVAVGVILVLGALDVT